MIPWIAVVGALIFLNIKQSNNKSSVRYVAIMATPFSMFTTIYALFAFIRNKQPREMLLSLVFETKRGLLFIAILLAGIHKKDKEN